MSAPPSARPYAPSWYDRFQDRIDDLPLPAWASYLIVCLVTAAILNAGIWLTGFAPIGTIDPYVNSGAIYLVIGYAGMHYLDKAAARAWGDFRGMTRLSGVEADRYAYELTTMPARPALLASVFGLVIAAVFVVSQYGRPFDMDGEPALFLGAVAISTAGFIGTAAAFYHAIHQLQTISRAHGFIASIDPLHQGPLHAFARVTAGTGILLLTIGYLALPTVPHAQDNPVVVVMAVASIIVAIACFVIPLNGIHEAIAAEKARRLAVVGGLVSTVLADIHRRAEQRDLVDADGLDKQLTSLLVERDLIARAPTWPWDPETLRGFSAAIVIPVGLWLVYRFLERAL